MEKWKKLNQFLKKILVIKLGLQIQVGKWIKKIGQGGE